MSSGNPWLQRQRKSDLIEIAERVGLEEYVPSVSLVISVASFQLRSFYHNDVRYAKDLRTRQRDKQDAPSKRAPCPAARSIRCRRNATQTTEQTRLISAIVRPKNSYDDLLKAELEQKLDDYLSQNSARFANDATLTPYWNSRARITGSPIKKEIVDGLKVARRRATRVAEEIVADP